MHHFVNIVTMQRLVSTHNSCILQAPRGTDLRQRALRMSRGHLRPGNKGEGCPGFRECFSYCYVWVPSLHFIYLLKPSKHNFSMQRVSGENRMQGWDMQCMERDCSKAAGWTVRQRLENWIGCKQRSLDRSEKCEEFYVRGDEKTWKTVNGTLPAQHQTADRHS